MMRLWCFLNFAFYLGASTAGPLRSPSISMPKIGGVSTERSSSQPRALNNSTASGAFRAQDIKAGPFLTVHAGLPLDYCQSYSVQYTDLIAKGDGTYRVPHSRILMDGKRCGTKGDNATEDELWGDKHMELMPIIYLANETISLQKDTNAAFFKLMQRRYPRAFLDFSLKEYSKNPTDSNTFVGFERRSERVCGDNSTGVLRMPKNTLIFFSRNNFNPVNLQNLFPNQNEEFLIRIGRPYHISFAEQSEVEHERVCPQIYLDPNRHEEAGETRMCFPGAAYVQLDTGTTVLMRDLRVGDLVLDGSGSYSPIYMFSHRSSSAHAEFINIHTDSGDSLTLSSGHYVKTPAGLSTAASLQVGEIVYTKDGSAAVTRVEKIWEVGLYNPHTMSGSIVVNNIEASVYTSAVEPSIAHSLLAPFRAAFWIYDRWHRGRQVVGSELRDGTNDFEVIFVSTGRDVVVATGAMSIMAV